MNVLDFTSHYQPSRQYYLEDDQEEEEPSNSSKATAECINPITPTLINLFKNTSQQHQNNEKSEHLPLKCNTLILGFDFASVYLETAVSSHSGSSSWTCIGECLVESVKLGIDSSRITAKDLSTESKHIYASSSPSTSSSSSTSSSPQVDFEAIAMPLFVRQFPAERAFALSKSIFSLIQPRRVVILSKFFKQTLRNFCDDGQIINQDILKLSTRYENPKTNEHIQDLPTPCYIQSIEAALVNHCEMFKIPCTAFLFLVDNVLGNIQYSKSDIQRLAATLSNTTDTLPNVVMKSPKLLDEIVKQIYLKVLGKDVDSIANNPIYM